MVGAQNAGKSSLINRLSKRYGGPGPDDGGPLASHLPGTTLGVGALSVFFSIHPRVRCLRRGFTVVNAGCRSRLPVVNDKNRRVKARKRGGGVNRLWDLCVLCTSTLCNRGGVNRLWALGVLCTSTLCKRGCVNREGECMQTAPCVEVVKLANLLPNGSDVYDTPGLLQPFQVASRWGRKGWMDGCGARHELV